MARALLASLLLPGIAAVAVPLLLARHGLPFHPAGLLTLVPGAALLLWCAWELHSAGRGTVAPWNPPRRLVTSGPYRHSRNPMYIAVVLVIAGWGIGFASPAIAAYAAVAALAFAVHVVVSEEPRLARKFRDDWTRYAARVPRWMPFGRGVSTPAPRWSTATIAATLLAVLILAAVAGLVYEAFAEGRDARDFPAPGEMVDVGGRRLHLVCAGEGTPTVIVQPGIWDTAVDAREVRERIAGRTRVCSYDPQGRGWSDPGPGPATATALANDLGVLQDRAGLAGPFVLVGLSTGGLAIELFARLYPERTAGLVFVDAVSSGSLPLVTPRTSGLATAVCARRPLAYVGVVRLLDPLHLDDGSEEGRRTAALAYNARAWSGLCATLRGVAASMESFADVPAFDPDLPVIVLSAPGQEPLPAEHETLIDARDTFVASHRELAAQSSRGRWEAVADGVPPLAERQPDAVSDAVLAIVDDARGRRPRDAR